MVDNEATLVALALALILVAEPALAEPCTVIEVDSHLASSSRDLTTREFAKKSPEEVRECMLRYWQEEKRSAEGIIRILQGNIARAEDGISKWTK